MSMKPWLSMTTVGRIPLVLLAICAAPVAAQSPVLLPMPNLDVNGTVRAIVSLPDGGVVFGGDFTSVNGIARGRIARLRPDGHLDPAWNPVANNSVYSLAVGDDGAVYAGGFFTAIGGQTRSRIAKLSGNGTGAADSHWNPSTTGLAVLALAFDGGSIYAGGIFTGIGGRERNHIARLSGDGSGEADAIWNPSADGAVGAVTIDAAGAIYVGGLFTHIGGQTRQHIARLSDSGAGLADVTWNPSADASVFALTTFDGAVYAGGAFSHIGGLARNRIARLSGHGTGAADATWNPSANDDVRALTVDGGGWVYAGGAFSQIGGQWRDAFVRLSVTGTGSADEAWNPSANGTVWAVAKNSHSSIVFAGGDFTTLASQTRHRLAATVVAAPAANVVPLPHVDLEVNGSILTLARQPDGGIVFGGSFTEVNGVARNRLARLRPDGSLDPIWDPSANDVVYVLAVDGNGDVYVGGLFTSIGGVDDWCIVKLSGSGAGAVDTSWTATSNNTVTTIALDDNGKVYVGGFFSSIGGLERMGIARLLQSDGSADPGWNARANNWVNALAVGNDGWIYAGGQFTTMSSQSRERIARLSRATGALDAAWNPSANGTVRTLAHDGAGRIYVGGQFTQISGQPRLYLARLSNTGTGAPDPLWTPSATDHVSTVTVDGNGSVYVTGGFIGINMHNRSRIVRLSETNGAVDETWNPSANATVRTLTLDGAGNLWLGGDFTQIGGRARQRIAVLPGRDEIFANGFE